MNCRLLVFMSVIALVSCSDKSPPVEEPSAPAAVFKLVDATKKSGIIAKTKSGTSKQEYICEVKSTGVGLLDADGDGLLDVLLVGGSNMEAIKSKTGSQSVKLFRNLGDFTFEDITEASGLAQAWRWTCAPACGDIDGDGDDDIYLTQIGPNVLLLNEGGRFAPSPSQTVADKGWGTSSAFVDIDRDGDLDIYVCNYLAFPFDAPPVDGKGGFSCQWRGQKVMCGPKGLPPQQDRILRNDGNGQFTDVTEPWGLSALPPSYGLGVVAGDFDRTGTTKIYVANDGMANFYLRWDNDQKRLIEEGSDVGLAVSEDGAPQAGMGVAAYDINGDGVEDFACTNFSSEVNNLYLSDSDTFWIESSAPCGVALGSLPALGWGAGFRDFNLDGRVDLFIANGHVYPQAADFGTGTDYGQYNQLYLGVEGERFELAPRLKHSGLAVKKVSRGSAFGDLDNDGDIDVVVVNLNDKPTMIENRTRSGNEGPAFVGVTLRDNGQNKQGLGAVVSAVGTKQSVTVRRHASFQSSNDHRVVFSGSPKEVEVMWPDGKREKFATKLNAYNVLEKGKGSQ